MYENKIGKNLKLLNHKINIKQLLSIALVSSVLITGCTMPKIPQLQQSQAKLNLTKNTQAAQTIEDKILNAIDNNEDIRNSYSKWFDRKDKLPLTIIATGYIDPDTIDTKEYEEYINIIKKISKNPKLLDKYSNSKLSEKYSSIKFVEYDTNKDSKRKLNLAYTYKYKDKDKLSDGLRPDIEKPSQELLITLNYEELEKGNLTIEGYKTVKQKDKKRNSYYYTLRKIDYKKLSKEEKEKAIVNSILASLQLSIPDFVSIDRFKVINNIDQISLINADGKRNKYLSKKKNKEKEIVSLKVRVHTGEKIKGAEGEPYFISSDGNYAIFMIRNGVDVVQFRLLDLGIKKITNSNSLILNANQTLGDVELTNDNKYLIISIYERTRDGYHNAYIYKITLNTGEIKKMTIYDGEIYHPVRISKNAKYALSRLYRLGDKVVYWDLSTLEEIDDYSLDGRGVGYFSDLCISPNGDFAIAMSEDHNVIRYLNLKEGEMKTIENPSGDYFFIEKLSKYGKYSFFSTTNKLIKINLETGNIVKTFNIGDYTRLEISENDKYALIRTKNKILKKIDLVTGKIINILKDKNNYVIKISPDGKYAINGYKYLDLTNNKKTEMIRTLNSLMKSVNTKSYVTFNYLQLILTNPLNIYDINTLIKLKYVDSLSINNIQNSDISNLLNVLNLSYNDPLLIYSLENYRNVIGSNIVVTDKQELKIVPKEKYAQDKLYFTSHKSLEDIGYKKVK